MSLREHYHQTPAAEMLRELASWPVWMSYDQIRERLVELLARRPLLCRCYYDTATEPGRIRSNKSKHWSLRYALELNGLVALDFETNLYCVRVRIPAPPSLEMRELLASDPDLLARTIPTREEREMELLRRAEAQGPDINYYRRQVELIEEREAAEAARAAGDPIPAPSPILKRRAFYARPAFYRDPY